MTKDSGKKIAANPLSARRTLRGSLDLRKVFFVALTLVLILGGVLHLEAVGFTRVTLTDAASNREIFAATLREGTPITLTWRNSLFNLDVTEGFVVADGVLIQTEVTFADPYGAPPPRVAPSEVDDLYHTGGAFSARGLQRPFTRIVYRVGEIGNPKLTIGAHVIEFKREVGFGGSIVLTTHRATWRQVLIR